jgi:glycolate oxidase FAD binding subunit
LIGLATPHDAALHELLDAVRDAADRRQPLQIVGAGTKGFYGGGDPPEPGHRPGEPLSLKALAGISSHEPTELVVTARAGTPLAELEATLAEKGQCLPFEPPRFGDAGAGGGTVGGMVAAGLAGPARAAVGGVRDYLLGASLINGRGELLSFGGQVMKNVAGYDVSRALAGSMGQLGVICEVSLKVMPVSPGRLTLRFDMDQANALRHLNEWLGQALPIVASAWWDGALLLRLQGARAAVASAAHRLGGEAIPEALADAFWDALRDQRDEFFQHAKVALDAAPHDMRLWRLSVAPTAPRITLAGEQLVEWAGGQRWLLTDLPPASVREAAADAMGHATVWRGPKACGAFAPLPPAQLKLQRALKAAFDPHGLFNPGRMDNL